MGGGTWQITGYAVGLVPFTTVIGTKTPKGLKYKGKEIMGKTDIFADQIWEISKQAARARKRALPNDQAAINVLFTVHLRLRELGWKEPCYIPKGGGEVEAISFGSTGIHKVWRDDLGRCWTSDGGDIWLYTVFLWRPIEAAADIPDDKS